MAKAAPLPHVWNESLNPEIHRTVKDDREKLWRYYFKCYTENPKGTLNRLQETCEKKVFNIILDHVSWFPGKKFIHYIHFPEAFLSAGDFSFYLQKLAENTTEPKTLQELLYRVKALMILIRHQEDLYENLNICFEYFKNMTTGEKSQKPYSITDCAGFLLMHARIELQKFQKTEPYVWPEFVKNIGDADAAWLLKRYEKEEERHNQEREAYEAKYKAKKEKYLEYVHFLTSHITDAWRFYISHIAKNPENFYNNYDWILNTIHVFNLQRHYLLSTGHYIYENIKYPFSISEDFYALFMLYIGRFDVFESIIHNPVIEELTVKTLAETFEALCTEKGLMHHPAELQAKLDIFIKFLESDNAPHNIARAEYLTRFQVLHELQLNEQ